MVAVHWKKVARARRIERKGEGEGEGEHETKQSGNEDKEIDASRIGALLISHLILETRDH